MRHLRKRRIDGAGFAKCDEKCRPCQSGCLSCAGDAAVCDVCDDNHVRRDGACFAKDTTDSASFNGAVGSESCLHTATTHDGACQVSDINGCLRSLDATACLVCRDGLAVTMTGACAEDAACPATHAGTCVSCPDGSFTDPAINACRQCPYHCTTCAFDASVDGAACSGCDSQTVLSDGK